MQEMARALAAIGLTLTESTIYLSCLQDNAKTVQEISRSTKIKRPTVYHAVGTLQEKGLIAEQRTNSKTRYVASNPDHLHSIIGQQRAAVDERSKQLDELMPGLQEFGKLAKKDEVRIVHYSGIEGMKMVMDIAFHCRSKQWDIVAPYNNFLREYDAEFARRYLNARKYHGIVSRTLWEEEMRPGRKLTTQEIRERNPRCMPKHMHNKFSSMMILFDDKVAIFSSYDKLSAILITSKELHTMFHALFEGVWEVSTPYQ